VAGYFTGFINPNYIYISSPVLGRFYQFFQMEYDKADEVRWLGQL
jgi:hypothetical protein